MERVRIRAPFFSRRGRVCAVTFFAQLARKASRRTPPRALASDEHMGVQVHQPEVDVPGCGVRTSMLSNLPLRRRGLRISTEEKARQHSGWASQAGQVRASPVG